MHKSANKLFCAIVTLCLLSSIAISTLSIPTANAQSALKTYAYVGATPNPIGVAPTNRHTLRYH